MTNPVLPLSFTTLQHPSRFFARRFSLIAKICRDGSIPMALISPIQVSIRDASRAAKSLPEDAPEDPLPHDGPESAAQAMPENEPRDMLESAAKALSENEPRGMLESAAQAMPENEPRNMLEDGSQAMLENEPRDMPEGGSQALPESEPRGMPESGPQAMPGAARSWEFSRYMLLSILLCVLLRVLLCVLFSTNFDPFLLFYARAARVLYASLSRPARGRTSGRKRNRMLPKGHPGFYGFM